MRERYKARYPTPERMGKLAFTDLEIRLLGEHAALVLGRWRLTDTPEAGSGVFTLVLQRIGGQWLIVHDHTSPEAKKRGCGWRDCRAAPNTRKNGTCRSGWGMWSVRRVLDELYGFEGHQLPSDHLVQMP
jgi:hypothetical protein